MNRIFLLLILTTIFSLKVNAQSSKEDVYNKLVEKYGGMKSVSASYSVVESPEFSGIIRAKTGNKYIIEMPSRTIVCNGKTLWNYSAKNNTVIINKFDPKDSDMPLDQLFFTFLYAFVPKELKKERNSAGDSYYSLTMVPSDKKLTVGNIQWLSLRCSPSDYNLQSLTVSDGSSVFTWELKELKINPKLEDKLFEFKKPKDVEEVDLR